MRNDNCENSSKEKRVELTFPRDEEEDDLTDA